MSNKQNASLALVLARKEQLETAKRAARLKAAAEHQAKHEELRAQWLPLIGELRAVAEGFPHRLRIYGGDNIYAELKLEICGSIYVLDSKCPGKFIALAKSHNHANIIADSTEQLLAKLLDYIAERLCE